MNDENEDDPYMEMKACCAWDQKSFLEKKIGKGQGQLGQCWMERESIYLSVVPQDFVTITSGLGEATPRCILMVPLKVNEEVYGVLELASLHPLTDHQHDFVERLAESIASAVAAQRTNEKTKNLLAESQLTTEQMRAQEEEMRQNMEELTATQEEMARKEKEYIQQIKELKEQLAGKADGGESLEASVERSSNPESK